MRDTCGQVIVGVDAPPGEDLNAKLQEIREYYEQVTAKNRKDQETWFDSKVRT